MELVQACYPKRMTDVAFSLTSICKATPTSASAKDGASLIPSPTLNTKGEYDLANFRLC